MGSSAEHSALVAAILAACGARPDCRLWANNTGVARGLTGDGIVRFGLKGSADIVGIGRTDLEFAPHLVDLISDQYIGVFLGIEVKTGSAIQSRQQRAFQAMIEKFGGYYLVARSVQDAEKWLDKVLG
jgi:hypothetical protein